MIRRQFMHRFQENRIEKINFNSTEVNSRSLEVKEYFLDMGILINSNEEFDDDFNDKILTPEPIMSFFDVIGKTYNGQISLSSSEFQAVQTDLSFQLVNTAKFRKIKYTFSCRHMPLIFNQMDY